MSAFFVTATGTDIGKTFVTAGLLRQLRQAGRAASAIKPVASGLDPAKAQESDPGILLSAMGHPVTPEEIARISPWRFQAPLSPDFAARREGRRVDFDALLDFCRRGIEASDTLFIEGVGGIMVPLDEKRTVLDWMAALRLPLILVGGSYVGTLSHTLTALDVLARKNLSVLAVVVSETQGSAAPLDETLATIARFADDIEVIGLPRLPAGLATHPAFARLAALL